MARQSEEGTGECTPHLRSTTVGEGMLESGEFSEGRIEGELVFVEVKIGQLKLIDLSQIIGYSCIALPIFSILIAPAGMGSTLAKLLTSFGRTDILEFRPGRKIQVLKWDERKQDIDRMNSIT